MHLSANQAKKLVKQYGSPLYVYSKTDLQARAKVVANLSAPFGLVVRYAIKANPHSEIINLFAARGLHFDASSSYEAERLLKQGIPGTHISLSSQQPAHNMQWLVEAGVACVATSMHQLELYAATPGVQRLGLRVNPGVGSGHNNRLTTAGRAASFGLWHAYIPEALHLAQKNHLTIDRLHVHIGTGADPSVWGQAIDTALELVERMPDVVSLDMGGGYKIAYTEGDNEALLPQIVGVFGQRLERFAAKTRRRLQLEIEPGRWLVAHAGWLLTEVVDIIDTGPDGYTFLRTNTGMNDILRPTMYGAQHGMEILNASSKAASYVVVGHNCETGDILTPAPHDPEHIVPRSLARARIGDLLAIRETGAYCASMRAVGYNDFPQAREVFVA